MRFAPRGDEDNYEEKTACKTKDLDTTREEVPETEGKKYPTRSAGGSMAPHTSDPLAYLFGEFIEIAQRSGI